MQPQPPESITQLTVQPVVGPMNTGAATAAAAAAAQVAAASGNWCEHALPLLILLSVRSHRTLLHVHCGVGSPFCLPERMDFPSICNSIMTRLNLLNRTANDDGGRDLLDLSTSGKSALAGLRVGAMLQQPERVRVVSAGARASLWPGMPRLECLARDDLREIPTSTPTDIH